jgi:hypothetical protein
MLYVKKLSGIEEHYEQLGRDLEEAGSDYQRAAEINKERVDLEPLVTKARISPVHKADRRSARAALRVKLTRK